MQNSELRNKLPLLIIVGATGCGKTKLAVQMCRRFNGEIISADSMQLYKNLPIATNVAQPDELCGIKQHLVELLDPLIIDYGVRQFRKKAFETISEIQSRNHLPVIVGGTSYYIESLLWDNLLSFDDQTSTSEQGWTSGYRDLPPDYFTMNTPQLYAELQKFDPDEAAQVHPNNHKRILSALQIFHSFGKRKSEMIQQQKKDSLDRLGYQLIYPDAVIFWVKCDDNEILYRRLDQRVDGMLKFGLRTELETYYDNHYTSIVEHLAQHKHTNSDHSKGVLQCIGLKEYLSFLKLTDEEKESLEGQNIFAECTKQMKLITRQYARRQLAWINNRFVHSIGLRQVPSMFAFDTSNQELWDERVYRPAESIFEAILQHRELNDEIREYQVVIQPAKTPKNNHIRYCNICDKYMENDQQWQEHIQSKSHRYFIKKQNK